VIYAQNNVRLSSNGTAELTIRNTRGRLQRYVPSGPAGEYTYIAVADLKALNTTPAGLDQIWAEYVEQERVKLGVPENGRRILDSLRVEYDGETPPSTGGASPR
jgi:hypothetical protein